MGDSEFLDVYEKELMKQGRKRLEHGGWSEQGVLDGEGINGCWPMGILTPGWTPCEEEGGECIPYNDDLFVHKKMIKSVSYEGSRMGDYELTNFGKWAPPKYVHDIVANGFSMSVWCPQERIMILLGMCSKCGVMIMRESHLGEGDSINWADSGWEIFIG